MNASRDDRRKLMAIVKSEGPSNQGNEGNEASKKSPRKRAASAPRATTTTTKAVASPEPAAPVEAAPIPKVRKAAASAAEREMVILDPTREEIAARAYELYVARGRRDGHSEGDWTRAEQELNAERERARRALRQPASRSTTES